MTEAEWLACKEPERLLTFLEGKVSPRRGRLIVAACCRLVWPLLRDSRCRRSVEVGEQYSEGLLGERDREAVYLAAERAKWSIYRSASHDVWPEGRMTRSLAASIASQVASCPSMDHQSVHTAIHQVVSIHEGHRAAVADVVKDICTSAAFPCTAKPSWLFRDARHIAESLSIHWDCSGLPILADALEDAGCDNADILSHCRGSGPHVRGCFVVDLLLGKE